MAINPFPRITPLEIPTALPSAARIDPSTFNNLASIGDALGERRERNALGEIARGAVGPDGQLDLNKFATAVALSGRDPAKVLALMQTERGQSRAEAAQRALEEHYNRVAGETERANKAREAVQDRPTTHIVPPTLTNPGGVINIDPRSGGVMRQPYPDPAVVPAPVKPQSALPGPNFAAAEPNPEEAQPYQVAGPPMPPPQATAAPARAPEKPPTAFNDDYLRTLPANGQVVVKGIANYEIDPDKYDAKTRDELVTAAKLYRPDYNTSEYQKRTSPPSGEIAARMGLAKGFLERTDAIRSRIQGDEINSLQGRALAFAGQGAPGELRRAVDEGAEALLRGLTGAGMNKDEAASYARRYQLVAYDTKDTQLRKINELENALRHVNTEVGKGRGGDDLMKDFRSKFGEPVVDKKVASDKEVNDLVSKATSALGRAPTPEARAQALTRVHEILQERGVPPQFWPR